MDKYYLVYRIYTKKERPNVKDRSIFYGWSKNKSIINAFMNQRTKSKYMSIKLYSDDPRLENMRSDYIDEHHMIDFVILHSSADPLINIKFFTTTNEMMNTEIQIQRLFHESSPLSNIDPDEISVYVNMMLNLKDKYFDALDFIGFRPQEIDQLYDSSDEKDNFNNLEDIENQITEAYEDSMYQCSEGIIKGYREPFGSNVIDDIASKVIYSIESFVKVLKDDL